MNEEHIDSPQELGEKHVSDYQELLKLIVSLPADLRAARAATLALRRKREGLERQKTSKERNFFLVVFNEKNAEGKPAFSNEKARDNAVAERCSKDPDYRSWLDEEYQLIEKTHAADAQLQYLEDVQRSVKMLIQVQRLDMED